MPDDPFLPFLTFLYGADAELVHTRLLLILNAPGSVAYKGLALSTEQAASLRVAPGKLTLTLADNHAAGMVTLTAPGTWKLVKAPRGVRLTKNAGGMTIRVPAGVKDVVLVGK